ncbi:DUF2752 domain-containing protein [Propionibacteriaceae bacterium Y2011]|uniref:DUF2752 domain-containing protein n=1 Tax=Microlunatus sp. Y2014 TaxID=3418488 RepID=UPI003B47EAB2
MTSPRALRRPPRNAAAARGLVDAPLLALAATGVFGLAASAVYRATGLGIPCWFRGIFGWDCPLCGGTRLGAALLTGDVTAAFWYNPLAFVGLGLAALVGVALVVTTLTGRRRQLAEATSGLAGRLPVRVTPGSASIAVGVVLVLWTLFRNIVLGPLP